ncbi:T9SS type A sorting domain-containing protein [Taibaiella soli]|uniref:Secretion system C-terminal sorting domain-containing protein n=1 Tax=Taibaiella soli TaxID=1649169 RepID=A0A2W2BF20_9BACT|nr:T9SS type A sorting domain-containing protein [Taibaiella soli]PZF74869.1 hypothetical protein DN068_01345 [Taibaiella soli]
MKKMYLMVLLLTIMTAARGQTFIFTPLTTPAGCNPADNYTLYTSFTLDRIVVTQIYSDDGVTGSFAFEVYVNITNVFAGNLVSTGNFYNYTPTLYSTVPNVPPSITNTSNIIPLGTNTISNIPTSTNPTYVGSASALGLVLNGVYTAPDTLALFGYDSASLEVNLPCIGDQIPTVQPLPVTMSALQGRVVNNKVNLYWTTFSEQNHAGFKVQRSGDGKSWEQIDWLPNSKNDQTEVQTNYSYVDQLPLAGNNYYKLIQVDKDGRSTQSNVVAVKTNNERAGKYTVYPNPVKDLLKVSATTPESFSYKLINAIGMQIASGTVTNGQTNIDVHQFANGLYILQLQDQTYPVEIQR